MRLISWNNGYTIQHNSCHVGGMLCDNIITSGWNRAHMVTLYMSARVMIMVLNKIKSPTLFGNYTKSF